MCGWGELEHVLAVGDLDGEVSWWILPVGGSKCREDLRWSFEKSQPNYIWGTYSKNYNLFCE